MDSIHSPSLSRFATRPRARSLFLVIAAACLLPLAALGAGSSRVPSLAAGSAPPAYPDALHVPEGCYISTTAYLARFRADHPGEKGVPLTVVPRGFGGPHTIALVTWQGRWWGRDEYSGVFDLRCAVAKNNDVKGLRARAESLLGKLASRQLKSGRIAAVESPGPLSDVARLKAVKGAASLLPCKTQIHWVRCSLGNVPLLFFEPAEGTIAVYDPAKGTATAECFVRSIPTAVTMVASELGYQVRAVCADAQFASAIKTR